MRAPTIRHSTRGWAWRDWRIEAHGLKLCLEPAAKSDRTLQHNCKAMGIDVRYVPSKNESLTSDQ
jgi:hypothetical protein